MVSFLKHRHFSGKYFLQNWSIPDSIIYSISKNPSNSKSWQKLIQCCKYFFDKNPILVVKKLCLSCIKKSNIVLNKTENKTPFLYELQKPSDFTNVLCKFWLTDLFWCGKLSIPFSTILSYFHQVDVKTLDIYEHTLSFHEFVFLTLNVENIYLSPVAVTNEDGTIVPLEKLVTVLPKIKKIEFYDNPIFSSITAKTVKELLEIPHFSKIDKFALYKIPEEFDIETFFTYLKKNKHTIFKLHFDAIISEGYKNRVKKIVDEIIAAPSHDYKVPHLYFHGIDHSKYRKMYSLFRQL